MNERLAEAVLAGQPRAIAKAITLAENGGEEATQLVARMRTTARNGHLIGFTGSPGAGKSSLICKLAKEFRARGKSVGIIAVDPSSPFSGGAVLGDRIRMQELACDPDVFVRSMASRGRSGGLSAAVQDAVVILRAAGKEIVLVETVGVGQGELDVASVVQTVVVVLTPMMGDEIQSLKAGILEVADIYVVNKADLSGADTVARHLQATAYQPGSSWKRLVIQTSTLDSTGISDLADAIDSHKEYLGSRRVVDQQEIQLTCKTILSLAGRQILDELESRIEQEQLERLATEVVSGAIEPGEAARMAVQLFLTDHLMATVRLGEEMEAVGPRKNGNGAH